jgi:small-conductance mechanosensitive channel
MVGMTLAPLVVDLLPVSSVSLLPPLAPRDALGELSNNPAAQWWWLIGPCLSIIATVVAAVVLRWVLHRAIDRVVDSALTRAAGHANQTHRRVTRVLAYATGQDETRRTQRAATMGAILKSTSTFVIFATALLTIMATLGLPLGPILASAGVGGIALAFGAQSLVKDVLSGIFMILEDQYGVGDVIDTGEAIGTVEDITLRVTRVRDASGVVWYIRNGEIVRIGNRSQGWSTAVVDIQIGYNESLDVVLPLIREVATALYGAQEWTTRLLEEPVVAGVESMTGGVITIRVIAKCAPNENFPVSRAIRERVKVALDTAGIHPPQTGPPYGADQGGPGGFRP